MNGMRKFVFFMTAIMLAAFALPATSATNTKSISLSVAPGTLTTTTTTITATITNTGNSNANSFEIDWSTSPQFTVLSGKVGSGPLVFPTPPGLKGPAYSRLIFTQQVPTKTSVTITLNVTVTSACAASSIDWWAYAWTGAPGPASQSFTLAPGPYTTSLPVATNCTLGFVTPPTDAFIGYTITGTPFNSMASNKVKVLLTQDGGVPPPTIVSLNSTPSTSACSISGTATTDASGYATFTTLMSSAGASFQGCQLTASAPGYSPSAISAAFNILLKLGDLSCASTGAADAPLVGDLDPRSTGAFTGNADSGLVRGLNSDDASCGPKVPYAFNYDSDNKAVTLIEDSLSQHPSVEYIILWPPVAIDSDGWAGKQPCVSWGVTNPQFFSDPVYGCNGVGSDNTPSDYVPALFCLSNNVDAGAAVMPDIPNVAPYAGNSHLQFQPTSLVPGNKAKVCVAQQGMTSANGQVQYWTKFIDQSDTGIRLP